MQFEVTERLGTDEVRTSEAVHGENDTFETVPG